MSNHRSLKSEELGTLGLTTGVGNIRPVKSFDLPRLQQPQEELEIQ